MVCLRGLCFALALGGRIRGFLCRMGFLMGSWPCNFLKAQKRPQQLFLSRTGTPYNFFLPFQPKSRFFARRPKHRPKYSLIFHTRGTWGALMATVLTGHCFAWRECARATYARCCSQFPGIESPSARKRPASHNAVRINQVFTSSLVHGHSRA